MILKRLKSVCGWFRISPPITATLANEVFVLFSNADSTSIESGFESGEMLLGVRGAKWTIGPGGNKLQTNLLELIAYGQRLSEPVVIANLARQEPFFVCAHAGVNPQAAIPLGEVWLVRQNSTKVLTKSIHWWPSTFSVQVAMRVYELKVSSFACADRWQSAVLCGSPATRRCAASPATSIRCLARRV